MIVNNWRETHVSKSGVKYEKEFSKRLSYSSVALMISGIIGVIFAFYFGLKDSELLPVIVLYCIPGMIAIHIASKNMFVQTVKDLSTID